MINPPQLVKSPPKVLQTFSNGAYRYALDRLSEKWHVTFNIFSDAPTVIRYRQVPFSRAQRSTRGAVRRYLKRVYD